MVLTLHYMAGSAPCHQVLLTAKALNLDLQLKSVNLLAKEQLSPEYVKINPQHTVPTLTDDDFSLWESRAIARYLVNKYSPESSLYPQEPRARALVDQRLDFDLGTLYSKFGEYFTSMAPVSIENKIMLLYHLTMIFNELRNHDDIKSMTAIFQYPQLMEGKEPDEAKYKKLQEILGFLDSFLAGSKYVAGSQPTIADFAIVASISTIDAVGVDLKAYPNITRWFELMKSTTAGYQDSVQKNVDAFKLFVEQIKNKTVTFG